MVLTAIVDRYAVESKLSHVQSFDRKFWAYKHPTFGQLIEADMCGGFFGAHSVGTTFLTRLAALCKQVS